MAGDARRASAEALERGGQRRVALISCSVERVVRGPLLRQLPDPLDRVELWRVGRKAKQFDAATIGCEPRFSAVIEIMAGPVVAE